MCSKKHKNKNKDKGRRQRQKNALMSRGIRAHNCRDLPPFKLFLFSHFTAAGYSGMVSLLATLALKQTHYVVGQILCVAVEDYGDGNGYNSTMTMTTSTSTSTALDHKVMLINMRSWPTPAFQLGLCLFFAAGNGKLQIPLRLFAPVQACCFRWKLVSATEQFSNTKKYSRIRTKNEGNMTQEPNVGSLPRTSHTLGTLFGVVQQLDNHLAYACLTTL